jgi:hypothetical protein
MFFIIVKKYNSQNAFSLGLFDTPSSFELSPKSTVGTIGLVVKMSSPQFNIAQLENSRQFLTVAPSESIAYAAFDPSTRKNGVKKIVEVHPIGLRTEDHTKSTISISSKKNTSKVTPY